MTELPASFLRPVPKFEPLCMGACNVRPPLVKVWKEPNCYTHIECEVHWTLHVHEHKSFFWYDTGTFCRLPIMSSIKENLSGSIMIQQSHTHTSSSSTYTIYIYMYIASSILCKTTKSDPLWVWGWNYGSGTETMDLRLKLWVWGWDYGSEAETMGLGLRLLHCKWWKAEGGGGLERKLVTMGTHSHYDTHTHMWLLASFPGPARSLLAVRNDDPWIIHGYIVLTNYWGG